MQISRFTAAFVVLSCSFLSACGQSIASEIGSAAAAATSEPSPDLKDILQSRVNAFALALQAGDTATVATHLSSEMLNRVTTRGPGTTFDEHLSAFVASEQRKLARDVGTVSKDAAGLSVQKLGMQPGGSIAVTLSFSGRPLPKPLYFVQEKGEYKLNIVEPAYNLLYGGTSYYQVENDDTVTQTFSCSGYGSWNIAPSSGQYHPALQVPCFNSCGSWFDGTAFYTSTGAATCDYNTWGIDMYIVNGNVVCSDRC